MYLASNNTAAQGLVWVLCCVNPDMAYLQNICFQPVLLAKDQTLQRLLGLLWLFAAEWGVTQGVMRFFFSAGTKGEESFVFLNAT